MAYARPRTCRMRHVFRAAHAPLGEVPCRLDRPHAALSSSATLSPMTGIAPARLLATLAILAVIALLAVGLVQLAGSLVVARRPARG